MIYLDTSALAKLLIIEAETAELQTWLGARLGNGQHPVISVIGRTELMRVVARHGEPGLADRARYLIEGLDILPLTEPVLALAESIGPAVLRTLDAIHLAAAASIKNELTAFVTYDRRLLDGCTEMAIATASPGA